MYNIEKAIREFNGEKQEVRVLSGVGNLTADIEAREVTKKNGENIFVVGSFGQSIAFNYYEKGERKAVFYPIEAWGPTAEALGKIGKKGMELSVVGRLEERSYTSPKTNKTYENEVLIIERFQVTSRGWNNGNKEREEPVDVEGFVPAEEEIEDIPF